MYSRYSFTKNKEYLVMVISGKYNYWDMIKYPKIIRNQCLKERIFKVMVNATELNVGEMPIVEQFFLGEHIADVLRDHIKLAVVWQGLYHSRFLQSVATNRSALLRIFRSVKNAEIWLLHDKENEPLSFKKG